MRKLISTILVLCMVLCLLPVTAAATSGGTTSLPTVTLDVGAENQVGPNNEYEIADDAIKILKDGVVYELTGTTDRPIWLWGANRESESGTIYLRLNNAEINGGIVVQNSPVKLVIEVLDGSANVTYISNSDYSPLKVGVKSGDPTHSLTMKGDSKLYCLQGVETSASSVSGLEAFNAAITLQDNAYLEAKGRATTGSYAGYGVIT